MPLGEPRVVLQPAGGPAAQAHYAKTVRNPLRLSDLLTFRDDRQAEALSESFPTGWLRAWGVTPGKSNVNKKKWIQFAAGDRVLFCGDNRVFASASLRCRMHNAALARHLWGTDAEGHTWEYMYFIGDTRAQDIPYRGLADVLEFAENFVVLGVNILDPDKSMRVIQAFDLADD